MFQFFLPLFAFALAASITPGPNTLMLAASGANFDLRATIPHIFGIQFGFPVMLLAIGLGFGQVFQLYPNLHTALKWVGTAFILYFAWKIAMAGELSDGKRAGSPMTFFQAALFQWLNPKAWVMGLSALTTYTTVGGNMFLESGLIALVFAAFVLPVSAVWCLFGLAIGKLLTSPSRLRAFNFSMGLLLAASVGLLYI
jgi:threonine/homoserine/homoserine lactone efflux protein